MVGTILLFTWALTLITSCQGEADIIDRPLPVEPITYIGFSFPETVDQHFTSSQQHPFPDTIRIDFPYYYPEEGDQPIDLTGLKLHLTVAENVTLLTDIPEMIDLTTPFSIEFRNVDHSKQGYVITARIAKNNRAAIKSFSIPSVGVNGIIYEKEKLIGINRSGKDLSNHAAEVTLSEDATISPDPAIPQNFNETVRYTVTAQDGTQAQYTIQDLQVIHRFQIGKGVNIASWISTPKYSGEKRMGFFTEKDVQLLSALGFDHIRLLVDEVQLWNEAGDKIYPYGFDLVHDAIEWCDRHNLKVVVDLHITRSHRFTNSENLLFTDPAEADTFVRLWQELSSELSQYPNTLVAYELLNEPVSKDPGNWNRVVAMAVQAIRELEPFRTIIVGVCTSNGAVMYNQLKLPDEEFLMMTFHYYGPYLLTAFGLQSTTGGRTDIPIQYPGQLVPDAYIHLLPEKWQSTGKRIYNKQVLEDNIVKGINRAKQLNVPVFLGEFGTLKTVPEPSRSNWYRDVTDILKKQEIPYTSFDYKGAGYSIVGEDYSILYPNIVDILTK